MDRKEWVKEMRETTLEELAVFFAYAKAEKPISVEEAGEIAMQLITEETEMLIKAQDKLKNMTDEELAEIYPHKPEVEQ